MIALHGKSVELASRTGNVAVQADGNVVDKFSHGTPITIAVVVARLQQGVAPAFEGASQRDLIGILKVSADG